MRELALDEPTDLVICPFRAMLHLPDHDARVERHAPRRRRRSCRAGASPGTRSSSTRRSPPRSAASGATRTGSATARPTTRPSSRIDLELEGGATVHLWWVDRDEWEAAIAEAGLEVEALYGWFDRRPFEAESPEFVWVARKP